MKSIQITLPNKGDIRIIPVSDLHIGSAKCNLELIKSQVAKIKEDPNTYTVLLGDLINNSTRTSVGDVFSQPLNPMEQMQMAIDIFEPIKDKILAITAGNHERRSYKNDGTDLTWFFATALGLESRYDYCAPLLFLKTGFSNNHGGKPGTTPSGRSGKFLYTIYMTHGDGANGRLVGGKANSLERRGQIVNADIVITGHTHQPLTFKESAYEIDRHSCQVYEKETTFVNCAATLGYEGYAELFGMRPSSIAQPEIIIGGKKKEVKVII